MHNLQLSMRATPNIKESFITHQPREKLHYVVVKKDIFKECLWNSSCNKAISDSEFDCVFIKALVSFCFFSKEAAD